MTLTPYASLYYGFMGGMITAGVGSSVVVNSVRFTHIHPDTAWAAALAALNENKALQTTIGVRTQYNSELIKGYRHFVGGLTIRNNRPYWASPKVEMLVKLRGEHGEVLVATRVARRQMKEQVDYLSLHFSEKHAKNKYQTVTDMVIVGDKNDGAFKDVMVEAFDAD